MTFLSYPFLWFLLPLGLVIYWCMPRRARIPVLLVLNVIFYTYHSRWRFWLLLLSIFITYFGARGIEAHRDTPAAKRWLTATLTANFSLLFLFKLQPLAVRILNALLLRMGAAEPALTPAALPLGLSFFIFSGCGYVIDVYWQHTPAQKDFLRHAAFISFFPTIAAGPILRGGVWYAQLEEDRRPTWDRLKKAFLLFLWGAFLKMVIADRIALYVDGVYADPVLYHGFYLLLAVLLYSLQIYADFAGYSMMALGVACAFGFDLPDNFRQPYLEGSIASFWRCWHISLTSWFRDYLYIPLGGNRKGKKRKYLNVLIVFLVSGFWHGAGLTFLIWGGLHGLYQIIGAVTQDTRKRLYGRLGIDTQTFSFRLGQRLATFALVSAAWVFFRAESLTQAGKILFGMLRLDNPWVLFNGDGVLTALGFTDLERTILLMALAVLLAVSLLQRAALTFDWLQKQGGLFQAMLYIGLVLAVLTWGFYGPEYSAAAFIYAGF